MIQRTCFKALAEHLDKKQITLLVGARQVGKTTLLRQLAATLDTPTDILSLEDPILLDKLNEHPEKLFDYVRKPSETDRTYVFIDEIQYLKAPSNFLKYIYDHYTPQLKLIVTGSSAFYIDRKFTDSLAGRKRLFTIHALSFAEYLSIHNITPTQNPTIPEQTTLHQHLQDYFLYGGYPEVALETDIEEKKLLLAELTTSFLKKDFLESNIQKPDIAFKLVRILAAQTGKLVNTQTLANTLNVSHDAIENYLYILQKAFIVQLVRPFHRNIKKEITKMPKLYFLDNGFRNTILQTYTPIADQVDSGHSFENLFFQLLLDKPYQKINFWRTQSKKEIDFILDEKEAYELKATAPKSRKPYQEFQDSYPEIKLDFVSLADSQNTKNILEFIYLGAADAAQISRN